VTPSTPLAQDEKGKRLGGKKNKKTTSLPSGRKPGVWQNSVAMEGACLCEDKLHHTPWQVTE